MPLAHLLGIHRQSLLSQEATKTTPFVDLQLWISSMHKISVREVVTAPKDFPLLPVVPTIYHPLL